MELELGLALPNPYQSPVAAGGELVGLLNGSTGVCGKKRVFDVRRVRGRHQGHASSALHARGW